MKFLTPLLLLPAVVLWAQPLLAQQATLNLSHDLTTLKIAAQNMTPDTPSLDSQPLLTAAVTYAQAHSIATITADPGAYYFLTGRTTSRYLNFSGLSNLTFDFAGSDLYFSQGSWTALWCTNCQNVQFLNFTLDALQLPFTQVRVTSVDTTANRIQYAPIAGWEAVTDFNSVRNTLGQTEPLYAFVFRDGAPLRSTSRIAIQRPVDPAFLQAATQGAPWEALNQLKSIQAGDIIALTARAGGATFSIYDSSNITVRNVAIYYGSQVGLMVSGTGNSTIDQVQVIPRPGTDRLVSVNADGISAVQAGQNLTIRRSRVRRNGDDGMSPNSQSLALVVSQPAPNQVNVTRSALSTFANGLQVQFIDNKTGLPAATAHITDQNPPYSTATPVANSAVTLTFDQNIPTLAANDPMVYADASTRGSGLVLENNLVEDGLFARGMSIWGILGGTIQGNVIRNVAWSGMDLIESLSTNTWLTGPVQNLTVRNNAIEQYTTAFGSGVDNAFAGVDILANDLNLTAIATASPFQNIAVTNNFISTGPYSGVRAQNINGGSVTGNLLMNVASNASANNPPAQYVASLGQPVAVASSLNVVSTPNTVDNATAPAFVTSAVSFSNEAIAPNSWAAVFGTNLAPQTDVASALPFPQSLDGVSIAIGDSAGKTTPAQIWFISSGQINFLVPDGIAPGAAVVTVTSGGKVAGRGGTLIDPLAPALFADGSGAPLGAVVLAHADGTQTVTLPSQPIDFGQPGDTVALVLYATGIRAVDSAANVTVFAGSARLPVLYAAAQPSYAGLDQINVVLPSSLRGAGSLPLRVVVAGFSTNTVFITAK
jgi:uncharacterized protein (TIGR03437 family)